MQKLRFTHAARIFNGQEMGLVFEVEQFLKKFLLKITVYKLVGVEPFNKHGLNCQQIQAFLPGLSGLGRVSPIFTAVMSNP